jgi:hypothetical protein
MRENKDLKFNSYTWWFFALNIHDDFNQQKCLISIIVTFKVRHMMSANPSSPGKNAKTVRSDTVTGVQTPTPLLVCEFPIILCMYEEKKK